MSLITSVPFTITPFTLEDANQVQANFASIVSQINTLTHICVIGGGGVSLSTGVSQALCTAATSAALISDTNTEFNISTGTFTPKTAGNYNYHLTIGLVSTGVTYTLDTTGALHNSLAGASTLCSLTAPSGLRLLPLVPYKQTEFAAVAGGQFYTFTMTANFSAGTPTIENYQLLITRAT